MAEQRYKVIDRLEAGGMAEVFRGESQSVQGFKKQVAIKRVLPHLAQNKNFIAMFLDEARLGARLSHANIVTVFDIGAADNTFFIVMEFIDGCNLKAVIEYFKSKGKQLPVSESVFICMEACRGLSYAHELLDEDDEPLDLVHRDISPPNLLLSKRGELKVVDFGLAKASTQLEKTDPGVVKGKFSYLSPEAALAQPVDARADIFGLGIVLWEMLAGRRLFMGETDYQTVKLVQEAKIPSLSRLNPEVDAELEELLGRALARDVADRFQSAREMGDALAGYLFSKQLKVTSYDIANMVKATLGTKTRKKPVHEASIIDRLIQEELLRFTSLDDIDEDAPVESGSGADGQVPLSLDGIGSTSNTATDLLGLENPADWFSDDDEVGNAIGAAAQAAGHSAPAWTESGSPDSEGANLASLLESDAPLMPHASKDEAEESPKRPSMGDLASDLQELADLEPESNNRPLDPLDLSAETPIAANPAEPLDSDFGETPRPPTPAPIPPSQPQLKPPEAIAPVQAASSGGAGKWIGIAVVVLAVAGAAAWFGGLIPH